MLVLSPELDNLAGVYAIRNHLNGKRYTGSTKRGFAYRRYGHLRALRRGEHHSPALQAAFDKYGEDAFEFVVLEVVESPTRERVLAAEQRHIDQQSEYNVSRVAGSPDIDPAAMASALRSASKRQDGSSSRFKGVSWYEAKQKWGVSLTFGGRRAVKLGYFEDEIEAALVYDAAVEQHFGADAFTNFPRGASDPTGSQWDNVNYYYTNC